jgi:hypothetical protein
MHMYEWPPYIVTVIVTEYLPSHPSPAPPAPSAPPRISPKPMRIVYTSPLTFRFVAVFALY